VGGEGDKIYVLLNGSAIVYASETDGSQVVLNVVGVGEVLGEAHDLDGLGHSASVTTLERCCVLSIERAHFFHLLHNHPVMAINVAKLATQHLRLATSRINAMATMSVLGRVAYQLDMLAQRYEGMTDVNQVGATVIPVRLTQKTLAQMVGASRGYVNEAMVYLKHQRAISVDRQQRVTVLSRSTLTKFCC
jgi:CRP-like cAMP-binding protein